MRIFVTGGSGFIGSHLVDALVSLGHDTVVYDNFSTGRLEFLTSTRNQIELVEADILDFECLKHSMKGCEMVIHLAANADVRGGLLDPYKDVKQNTLGTHNVLEAMRANGISRIAFSSTSSVYGEATQIPTQETESFPIQTSLYGASKLAGEALIQAYCEGYGFRGWIFRFVSIVGPRYSHGHIYDFVKKLDETPGSLEILGNGLQRKSYLHVADCVAGMLCAIKHADQKVNIFNIAHSESCTVLQSAGWISEELGLDPTIHVGVSERGWLGDNPTIVLDASKLESLGWRRSFSLEQGIRSTVLWLRENRWVYRRGQ